MIRPLGAFAGPPSASSPTLKELVTDATNWVDEHRRILVLASATAIAGNHLAAEALNYVLVLDAIKPCSHPMGMTRDCTDHCMRFACQLHVSLFQTMHHAFMHECVAVHVDEWPYTPPAGSLAILIHLEGFPGWRRYSSMQQLPGRCASAGSRTNRAPSAVLPHGSCGCL